ncbi:deaminase domain-containing protein [Pseudomonas sp. MWU15-20650]|uniref:deaminase domain-containing protein n=1 Tax=Pseudomonas sp. MWU15-20650 TaxID=2933107 RepID=UPI00200D8BF9
MQERGFSLDGQPVSGAVNGQGPLALDNRSPSITRVQGLPEIAPVDNSHKYLIETNPALTDLKQFMSSDYLLGKLGYNPDASWKRLGDGLYEQRLIREAVVARTGQRYINGIASDDKLFRYLMDNAISYKDSLNLQLGVSLSAAQVAALTHDIVWMEEAEVNGQKVLTPVLYLAQANNRLAPNGALIQGQDVSLITGGDLHNSGTLRATNNLSMVAGNIDNSGLMQAGNRLEMLATDSIRNSRGGIINGRDISATAVTGDIINERTVTTFKQEGEGYQLRNDVVSEASRFEAIDTLKLNAGRDVLNLGSHLKAGGNASVSAGRDVVIASQTEQDDYAYQRRRVKGTEQTTLQHASGVDVGGNLAIDARRDIAVVASTVSAAKDLSVKAGNNLTLAAAANEEHEYSKGKKGDTKTTTQLDNVTQQSAELKAGGDLVAIAGTDLTLVASKISAGNEAYVHADNELQLLAAQDSHYSLYDMSKKGGWGSKKTQRDEVTDVKNVGSEIKTGGDLTLESGGDQKYQAAKLDSGGDIAIVSGGAVTFEAVKDLHDESHTKSKSDMVWTSSKGKGNTDETLRQTQMIAQGSVVIKAVDGLKIDVKQIDQHTVSQTIDVMVKADPQLAWLKEAEQRGDVDWRKVQEVHDSFKYNNSSLGGGAALVIAIIVTYFTWGAGAGLVGAASTTTTGLVANSVVTAVAVKGATSTINNKGNLGDIAKDVTSGDSLKGYAIAGLSGAIAKFAGVTGEFTAADLGRQLAVNSALRTVTNGGSFTKNIGQAAIDLTASVLSGMIYERVGTELVGSNLSTKVAVHAIVGGLIAEAAGGDFASGAIAAGANKALIQTFGEKLFPGEAHDRVLAMTSQLIGMTVAAGVGGSAKDQEVAGWVAQQGTIYNELQHKEVEALIGEAKTCTATESCRDVINKYADLNEANEKRLNTLCESDPAKCKEAYGDWVASYDAIHEMISQVRAHGDLPDEVDRMLGAVDLMNVNSRLRVAGVGIVDGALQAASNAAGEVGVDIAPETVGMLSKWTAMLFGVKKAGGAKATATVIDTAPMAQRVMDVRAGLPSGLRRSGNVAVAEIDIPGIPKQMAAHSQVSDAGKGLIGSGNGNFVAQSVPNKAGDLVYRGIDTEYKILDNIADQLGRNTSARGTVNILTEKAACASCLNVAEQFKAKYPNITVNILDNQGVMLRPPRKTP